MGDSVVVESKNCTNKSARILSEALSSTHVFCELERHHSAVRASTVSTKPAEGFTVELQSVNEAGAYLRIAAVDDVLKRENDRKHLDFEAKGRVRTFYQAFGKTSCEGDITGFLLFQELSAKEARNLVRQHAVSAFEYVRTQVRGCPQVFR